MADDISRLRSASYGSSPLQWLQPTKQSTSSLTSLGCPFFRLASGSSSADAQVAKNTERMTTKRRRIDECPRFSIVCFLPKAEIPSAGCTYGKARRRRCQLRNCPALSSLPCQCKTVTAQSPECIPDAGNKSTDDCCERAVVCHTQCCGNSARWQTAGAGSRRGGGRQARKPDSRPCCPSSGT